jgi:hypothetical protein
MKSDSGFLQAAGFLFKRNLRFDWASNSPTDHQKASRLTLLLKKTIPIDRAGAKCPISTIGTATQMASSEGIKKWTSKEVAPSLPAKGQPSILLALFALTPCLKRTSQPARLVPVSRLNPVLEPHGTPTRWDKL